MRWAIHRSPNTYSATKRKRAGIVIDARRDRHNMAMQLVTPRVVAMAVAMETMS